MMKKNRNRVIRCLLVAVVVTAIMLGVIATPDTKASSYYASYIEELTGIKPNYKDYFDRNDMSGLEEYIREKERITLKSFGLK